MIGSSKAINTPTPKHWRHVKLAPASKRWNVVTFGAGIQVGPLMAESMGFPRKEYQWKNLSKVKALANGEKLELALVELIDRKKPRKKKGSYL